MHTPWQEAGAMGGRQQPVGALGGHLLSLLSLSWLSPHTPCLKNQQPSFKAHPIPTPLTQQAREAPRNPLGEIQSPYLLILRTSHHRIEEKIMTLSTFQLAFPLHRGGTDQGLAAPQLFLPSDFRNCRPVLVTGHHSQLKSVHSNHKESKPQYTAAHGHSHHYTGHMDPNYRASFQGPWAAQGIRRDMRPIAANSLCLSEEDTKFRLPVSILQRASKLNVPVVCGRPSPE